MAYPIANAVWGGLFLYAALVQLNDPDPVRWVLTYLAAAGLCGLAIVDRLHERLPLAYAGLATALAGIAWLRDSGESRPMSGFPYGGALQEEIVREVLGLLLIAGWMIALGGWTRARRRARETDPA